MDQRRLVRVFVSSPSDVRPERLLAERLIERLGREFAYHLRLEAVLWEREPLVATHHFQDFRNIPPPRTTDIVVVILWSRLGVLLPDTEFRGAISNRPVTGTEWEFEDALAHAKANHVPDLLVYRKSAPIVGSLDDDDELERQRQQKRLVEDFIRRWFQDADAKSFTAAFQTFGTSDEFETQLYDHLYGLLERRLPQGTSTEGVRWHKPPFVGLRSFELDDAPIFFGRTRARHELRALLAARAAHGRAFVLVMGGSGSGKSSLVKAGLLPDLKLQGMIGRVALCRHAVLRPGGDPIAALAHAILGPDALPELGAAPFAETADSLAGLLRDAPMQAARPIRQGLAAAAATAQLTAQAEARLVLVVDQLDELFTQDPAAGDGRDRFVMALAALADCGVVWVVATLRSDFFDRLERLPALATLAPAEARYLVVPPDESEIGQVIRQPAREAGLQFEIDGRRDLPLDEAIRRAVGRDPAALPLLSFLLEQLWAQRTEAGMLTFEAYHRLGGLEGAIAERARQVEQALPEPVRASLPGLLRALVTIRDDQAEATARPVARSLAASTPERRQAVEALVAARLLVADAAGDGATLRLAHEALIARWPRLRDLVADDRGMLRVLARIRADEARWRAGGGPDDLLLPPGRRLAEARDLLAARRDEVEPPVVAFVEASIAADAARVAAERAIQQERLDRQVEAARASKRIARVTAVGLVLALGLAAVAGWFWKSASEQREIAAGNARRAEANAARLAVERSAALLAQSQLMTAQIRLEVQHGRYERAALLARAVLPADLADPERPFWIGAWNDLIDAAGRDLTAGLLRGHRAAVTDAAFSPDGRRVVTASEDRTARLWDAETGAALALLDGHDDQVRTAAFSADGRRIVTASRDGTARLWDAGTGAPLVVLRGHSEGLLTAAFSPDGRHVVTAARDGTARLWDAATGEPIAVLAGHAEGTTPAERDIVTVRAAQFSPDGRRVVTGGDDGTARLWDAATGAPVAVLAGHASWVNAAVFSPDGRRVLTGSPDKTARLWDAETGAQRLVLSGHGGGILAVAVSPDGRTAATASEDRTARLWDAETGQPRAVLSGHEGAVVAVSFSADGRSVLTASLDRTVRLWNAGTGAAIAVLDGHDDAVVAASLSPDGRRIVTASRDGTARLWDRGRADAAAVLAGHEAGVQTAAFGADGRHVVTTAWDGTARLWDAGTGAPVAVLGGPDRPVTAAVPSPDGRRIVTVSLDHTARLWETGTGGPVAVLGDRQATAKALAFSPDGRSVLTASDDGTAWLWDAETGRPRAVLRGHTHTIGAAAFSLDGRRVATGSRDGTVRLWDDTGRPLTVVTGSEFAVAVRADGRSVATVSDKTAWLWDAESGGQRAALDGHTGMLDTIAFSADGRRVATAALDGTVRLWDAGTGAALATVPVYDPGGIPAPFSPDGKRIATVADDRMVRLWDTDTGQLAAVLSGHDALVSDIAFSPDSRRAVTASGDDTARVWDVASGLSLAVLRGHGDRVRVAAFSPDGRRVVTGSDDSTARLWDVPPVDPQDLVAALDLRTVRGLTDAERQLFFLAPPSGTDGPSDLSAPARCDRLAASPYDPVRTVAGIAFDRIDAGPAVAACRQAVAAQPSDGRLQFQLGRALDKAGAGAEALAAYRAAADRGHAGAMRNLAQHYIDGDGVARDDAEADRLLQAAFDHGYLPAAGDLGSRLWARDAARHEAALAVWRRAAAAGDPFSHVALAERLERGDDIPRDLEQAALHFGIAVRLFETAGDDRNGEAAHARRGTLGRALTTEAAARTWRRIIEWRPGTGG